MCAPSHLWGGGAPICGSMVTGAPSSKSPFEISGPEAAARALARLAGRLDALDYRVAEVESAAGLPALWLDRGVANRPAAVLSTRLEADAFDAALEVMCKLAARRPLSLLVYGPALKPPRIRKYACTSWTAHRLI